MHFCHWHHHHDECVCKRTSKLPARADYAKRHLWHQIGSNIPVLCQNLVTAYCAAYFSHAAKVAEFCDLHWAVWVWIACNLAVVYSAIDCCSDVQELTDARLPSACHDGHWRQSQRYPVWLQGTVLTLHHGRLQRFKLILTLSTLHHGGLQRFKLISHNVYLYHPRCMETVPCLWDSYIVSS